MHPLAVKHLLLPLHEFFLRRNTLPYLRQLDESQWWSVGRLKNLQETKLRRLLVHAAEKCPFHRERIRAAGVNPSSAILADLSKLPTLTKADLREHSERAIDASVPGGLRRYTTGGSTGDPLIFYIDRARQAADQAARARTRRWFGIDLGERELYLWGSPIELSAQDQVKRLRDKLTNHCLLSAFEMTPPTMLRYLTEIRRFDPVHIFGYPSSIARLFAFAAENGIRIQSPSLKAIFTTGEVLTPADRAVIEESVSVPVADGYGSREGGFAAHQCLHGSYHVTMESLIVELLDADEQPTASDQTGEITLTHLDALGMPFIRYRTGDLARWSAKPCSCGRGLESLEQIEGRQTDMLRTVDGGHAHALSVIYVLREEPSIQQFKVMQRKDLGLDVDVVATPGFDLPRQQEVCSRLKLRIGESVDIRLNLVKRIAPEPSGKHRYVVRQDD